MTCVCVCLLSVPHVKICGMLPNARIDIHTHTPTSHTSDRADVNVLLLKFAEFITNCPSHAGTQARSCLLGGTGLTHMLKDNLKWVAHVFASVVLVRCYRNPLPVPAAATTTQENACVFAVRLMRYMFFNQCAKTPHGCIVRWGEGRTCLPYG